MSAENVRVTVLAISEDQSDADEIDSPSQQPSTTLITFDGAAHTIPTITPHELKAKTIWIRDELEPHVARNGSRHLPPDTVLELNAFFILLRDNIPRLTLDILRQTRVHRALVLISGRGTRWPAGLIDICDTIIAELAKVFGKLELIRPLLYEKGGRLAFFSDEQKLGRHGMIMKWLSDPSSGVSPLGAHESGHLGFKPGTWWIHPVFAFHAGIIDSPDPHGGISADQDGAYAILVTGNDEVASESAESFTYRCRLDDKGKHRLMAAIRPPKLSIRVLRSHTLHSPYSPAAGIRYEGLFKVSGIGMHEVRGKITFDIKLYREMDQISMREVQLRPTAEDVDDYIEYKRIRGERQAKFEDAEPMPTTKIGQLLMHQDHLELAKPLKTPASVAFESPLSPPKILPPLISPSAYATSFDQSALSPIPEDPGSAPGSATIPHSATFEELSPGRSHTGGLAAARSPTTSPATPGVMTQNMPGAFVQSPGTDGTNEVSSVFAGIASVQAAIVKHLAQYSMTPDIEQAVEEEAKDDRKDSAYTEASYQGRQRASVVSIRSNSSTASAEFLATRFEHLKATTMRKGSMGTTFSNDLKAMAEDLQQMRLENTRDIKGKSKVSIDCTSHDDDDPDYLEQCLKGVHDDVNLMVKQVPVEPFSDTSEQIIQPRRDSRRDSRTAEGDIREQFLARRPDTTQVEFRRSLYSRETPEEEDDGVEDVYEEGSASPLERFRQRYHGRNASSPEEASEMQEWLQSDED